MHTAPGMHVIICFTHSCSLLLSTGILYHKLRGNNKKPTVFYAFTCNTYSRLASFEVGCRTNNSLISTFFLCPVKCLITSFIHIMKADLCMFNKTAAYAYGQRFLHLWQADGANTPSRVSITCCSCASFCIPFRYMQNSLHCFAYMTTGKTISDNHLIKVHEFVIQRQYLGQLFYI